MESWEREILESWEREIPRSREREIPGRWEREIPGRWEREISGSFPARFLSKRMFLTSEKVRGKPAGGPGFRDFPWILADFRPNIMLKITVLRSRERKALGIGYFWDDRRPKSA